MTTGKLEKPLAEGSTGRFWSLAADPATGHIFILNYGNNDVQEVSSEGNPIATFGAAGSGAGQMKSPEGIGVGPGSKVYVVDTGNERGRNGKRKPPKSPRSPTASPPPPTSKAASAAQKPSHRLKWKRLRRRFRPQPHHGVQPKREYVRMFGSAGSGNGQFSGIEGLATNAAGDVYATDHGNARVQEFDPEGKFIRAFGSYGVEPGGMSEPSGIAVDQSGNVWVRNNRSKVLVQEFTAEGQYVANSAIDGTSTYTSGMGGLTILNGKLYMGEWAEHPHVSVYSTTTGKLEKPLAEGSTGRFWSLAADPATGHIFILNYGNNDVQEVSSEGNPIATFGAAGSGAGQMKAQRASGLGPGARSTWSTRAMSGGGMELGQTRGPHQRSRLLTPKSEASASECRNHPEWTGLPCQTKPVEQPETAGVPNLPVSKTTYNIWDEPVETVETFSSKERGTTDASSA